MYRLSTLLSKSAEKFPDKIALVINQQCYTCQELYELTHYLAASLLEIRYLKRRLYYFSFTKQY